ncbi:(4Fe-4S)-binding protein [Streptomyces sp. NBC_00503]|uniref:(4Fe-4S)-binding protein n=1 Tax=Streptomyces sp. NBC_00503 TaxID=2903659 RepID=UPI002E808002|nr:(4Fe-4S)-binding protein [Streptomyces sp. NBC_00503]WUD84602.1 (4Fe-4S)-binding protein [Streptomyces sp. NBC_00503]
MPSEEPGSRPAPQARPKVYEGERVTVSYDAHRCLHAAECARGLPAVFDPAQRPWVRPDGDEPERVAEVIRRCPSGALQYRLAEGPAEEPDRPTSVVRSGAGQLVLRGELAVTTPDGAVHPETRVMLCACGVSGNQPYCDHSGPCGQG